MSSETAWNEPLVEQTAICQIEADGQLLLMENVPVKVNVETGERNFTPETVERLQNPVWGQCCLDRATQESPWILIELDGEEHFDLHVTNSRIHQLF